LFNSHSVSMKRDVYQLILIFSFLFRFYASAVNCTPPPAGLIGWWQGEGNALDIVGGYNGILTNGVTFTNGVVDQAFSFDGTNGFVQVPNAPALDPSNLTIESWIKFNSLDSPGSAQVGEQYLVFKQNSRSVNQGSFEGYSLIKYRTGGSDYFFFEVTSASGSSAYVIAPQAIQTKVWYYVAAERGSNYIQLYVNGQFGGQATVTFPQNYGTNSLFFGTSGQSGWDRKLAGDLDEISLYNRALSSNEILAIYNAGSAGKCLMPVITAQPQSQAVVAGSNAVFNVVASGQTPLFYQWLFDGTNLTDSAHITGSMNATLTINNVIASDTGDYQVVVANSDGSVTSSNATLTVDVPPYIVVQPSNQVVAVSSNAAFSVFAGGTAPLSYQWFFNGAPLIDGGRISGSTTANLNLASVQVSDGGLYQVFVTNNYGLAASAVVALGTTFGTPGVVRFVDITSTNPVPPYASWSTAAPDIQDAIDVSTSGGTVLVAPGVYTESVNFYGKAILVTSISGPSNTLINPPAGLAAVTFASGETSNSILCGFEITNGGIYLSDDSGISTTPTIMSNWLLNCGINCAFSAAPFILYNTIKGASGAAISLSGGGGGVPFIEGNIIENNGGGISMDVDSPTIINNVIENNQGDAIGMINECDANIIQNVIVNNTGSGINALVPSVARGPWLINNTFSGNGGNGVYLTGYISSCQIVNNIVVGSPAVNLTPWYGGNPPIVQFNDFSSTNGNVYASGSVSNFNDIDGNISTDPLFVSMGNGDLHLQSNSPCVDAGTNAYVMTITDFGGGPRIIGGNVDMGAYEFHPSHFLALEIEPLSQTVPVGQTATFNVTAVSPDALAYQWLFAGTNIAGANNSSYTISNVQSNNAGVYNVVISNTVTSATIISSNAVLTVIPPALVVEPAYLTVAPGSTAMFSVDATGFYPIGFQWQFNGTNLPGATNSVLVLTNANSGEVGTYSVTVSNLYGSVTSTNVTLSVSPVAAWGDNSSGETAIPTSLTNAIMISAGYYHALSLRPDGSIGAWGDDSDGDIEVPTNLSSVVEISAGGYHNLALKSDGTVVAWGAGQVDHGIYANDLEHGQSIVPAGLSNVVGITAGGFHSLALKSDGTVVAWGWNLSGQTSVPTGLSNVVALAAGWAHTLALKSDGTIVGWGYSYDGELNMPSNLSNVVALAAGYYFSMALKADGSVLVWGDDSFGETNIPIGLSNVIAIAASGYHCLALESDGTLIGWGDNSGGQNDIPAGLTNVVMISSGAYYNLAIVPHGSPATIVPAVQLTILGGGTVFVPAMGVGSRPLSYQWESDGTNLVGATNLLLTLTGTQAMSGTYALVVSNSYGATTSSNVSLTVIPLLISSPPSSQNLLAGTNMTLTVAATGWTPFVYQWQFNGTNLPGATNLAMTVTNIQPFQAGNYAVAVGNVFGAVTTSAAQIQVAPLAITTQPQNQSTFLGGTASFNVSAAIEGPFTYQWQLNGSPIGGATNNSLLLTNVQFSQAGLYSVIVQNNLGAVLSSNAMLYVSQGAGWGYNSAGQATVPQGLTNVAKIAAGGYHSLALLQNGTVVAWGLNQYGQTTVPAGLSNVEAIAAGGYHSLALMSNGTVQAWGLSVYGQTTVPTGSSNCVAIAAGYYHSVAVRSDGTVMAWGINGSGQTSVPVGLSNVVAVAAGGYHTLVLKSDSTVSAWGLNNYNQTNVPVGLSNVVAISAGLYDSLALRNDGTVIAWGNNSYNQTNIPTGLSNVVAIAAGGYHNLALKNDGTVVAWGNNNYGQTSGPNATANVEAVAGGLYHSLILFNPGSPYITEQPVSRTIDAGAGVNFNAAAMGLPALTYQWQFNGTNVDSATNTLLVLTNVPLASAGQYTFVVSNLLGVTASYPAFLNVLRTTPQFGNNLQWGEEGFGFTLNGLSGHGPVVVYASTNLMDWLPIYTNPPVLGTLQVLDPSATNSPIRFYRALEE
jgi:alpha-tubulin suppressor-like RCC1 family protein